MSVGERWPVSVGESTSHRGVGVSLHPMLLCGGVWGAVWGAVALTVEGEQHFNYANIEEIPPSVCPGWRAPRLNIIVFIHLGYIQ